MKSALPVVSVVIPARNEEEHIYRCLDSILNNGYPKSKLEIIVADGRSDDKTREIVRSFPESHDGIIRLVDNPKKVMPSGFNTAIKDSRGEFIILISGHISVPEGFIGKNIEIIMERKDADCVGGVVITLPGADSMVSRAISLALSSPFGVGNSYFRIGVKKPMYVDTVAYGCYRREVFDAVGLFREELTRNQDIEFSARLRKTGRKILLSPEIKSYYHARPTLPGLCKQSLGNGIWNIYLTRLVPGSLSARHFAPLLFVMGLIGSFALSLFTREGIILLALICGSYLCAALLFSVKIGLKEGIKYIPVLVIAFLSLHLSYGLGMLWGIFTGWGLSRKYQQKGAA